MAKPKKKTAPTEKPEQGLGRALGFAFASGLLLRGFVFAQLAKMPSWPIPIGDGESYTRWAQTIVSGNWLGTETFYQAPFYPYFLAVIQTLFGPDLLYVRMIQAVLGASSGILLALAAHAIWQNRRQTLAIAWIWAFYAPAIYFDSLIQKPSLAVFLLCLALYLFTTNRGQPKPIRLIACGFVLACSCLTRENAILLLPFFLLWAGFFAPTSAKKWNWIIPAWLVLGLAVPFGSVLLRNRIVGGEWVLTTSQFGPNFYIGNRIGADGRYMPLTWGKSDWKYERKDAQRLAEQAVGHPLTAQQVSQYWSDKTKQEIASDPMRWIGLLLRKSALAINRIEIADTEDIYTYRANSWILDLLHRFSHFGLLLAFAVMGLILQGKQLIRNGFFLNLFLVYWGSVVLFFVFDRYRFPLVVFLLPYAAAGLCHLYESLKNRKPPAGPALVGALAALGLAWIPFYDPAIFRANSELNFGQILNSQEQNAEAKSHLEKALELDPDRAQIKVTLANVLTQLSQYTRAKTLLSEALEKVPTYAEAANQLGLIALLEGQPQAAFPHIQKALDLNPDLVPALNNAAWLAVHHPGLATPEQAVQWAQKACSLSQFQDAGYLDTLADCQWALGASEAALATIEQGLALGESTARQHLLDKQQAISAGQSFSPQMP